MKPLLFYIFLFLIPVGTGFSQKWEICNKNISFVTCIASDSNRIFVGTGISGIYLSTDNGDSWKKVNSGLDTLYISTILVRANVVFAGTPGKGIFKSTNYGDSWIKLKSNLPINKINLIKQNTKNIFTDDGMTTNIFKSSDEGKSWELIINGYERVEYISLYQVTDSMYYVLGNYGLCFSSNEGKNWNFIKFDSASNFDFVYPELFDFEVKNSNLYFVSKIGLGLSTNNGRKWTRNPQGWYYSFAFYGDILFLGTQGGLTYGTFNNLDTTFSFVRYNNQISPLTGFLKIINNYLYTNLDNLYRMPLKYFDQPNVIIQGTSNSCKGDTTIFSTEYEEYDNTSWRVEGGTVIGTPTDSNVKVLWDSPGSGRVILTKQNKTTQVVDSSSFSVTIYDIPGKPIASFKNDTLRSNAISGNQWYKNGDSIKGATEQFYSPKDSGYYSVQVTINGCSSEMSEKYWVEALGVYEVSITQKLILSPNPVSDFLEISVGVLHAEPLQSIEIFSVLGEKVLTTPALRATPPESGGDKMKIDVSSLPQGIYFVKVGCTVRKFVKL